MSIELLADLYTKVAVLNQEIARKDETLREIERYAEYVREDLIGTTDDSTYNYVLNICGMAHVALVPPSEVQSDAA